VAQHPTSASPDSDTPADSDEAVTSFRERLYAPVWLWLLGVAVAAPLAAEVYLGAPGQPLWLPYVVLIPLVLAILAWLGRIRVRVAGGELLVDDARLPVRFIERVGVLDAEAKRDALGIHADPLAFVIQRPWIREAVLVVLDDPADPTPYWVVSSRRPRQLVEALRAAMAADGR
jgi:Protein of unknown function (DUF3093)